MRIRGERRYLFAILDAEMRYWLAQLVATHKGTDDVRPMFREANEVAGKTPSRLISDRCPTLPRPTTTSTCHATSCGRIRCTNSTHAWAAT